MSVLKAKETGMADQVSYKVVEGWEQLPRALRIVMCPVSQSIRRIAYS